MNEGVSGGGGGGEGRNGGWKRMMIEAGRNRQEWRKESKGEREGGSGRKREKKNHSVFSFFLSFLLPPKRNFERF